MTTIYYEGRELTRAPEETVLECLQRSGVPVPSSCRAGACQSCLLRAVEAGSHGSRTEARASAAASRRASSSFQEASNPGSSGGVRLYRRASDTQSDRRSSSSATCRAWTSAARAFR